MCRDFASANWASTGRLNGLVLFKSFLFASLAPILLLSSVFGVCSKPRIQPISFFLGLLGKQGEGTIKSSTFLLAMLPFAIAMQAASCL